MHHDVPRSRAQMVCDGPGGELRPRLRQHDLEGRKWRAAGRGGGWQSLGHVGAACATRPLQLKGCVVGVVAEVLGRHPLEHLLSKGVHVGAPPRLGVEPEQSGNLLPQRLAWRGELDGVEWRTQAEVGGGRLGAGKGLGATGASAAACTRGASRARSGRLGLSRASWTAVSCCSRRQALGRHSCQLEQLASRPVDVGAPSPHLRCDSAHTRRLSGLAPLSGSGRAFPPGGPSGGRRTLDLFTRSPGLASGVVAHSSV